MEKTFGDIMVGDKLYFASIDGFGIFNATITSMELDQDALRDMDHRVPDVVIKTTEFDLTLNKVHLTVFKNKVVVMENGTYVSPSRKFLTEAIIKEINSHLNFWEARKQRIIDSFNNK